MATFANSIVLAFIQVTLALVPTGPIVLLLDRRNAVATAAISFTALLTAAALTIAAYAPVSDQWTWAASETPVQNCNADAATVAELPAGATPAIDVFRVLRQLQPVAAPSTERAWDWRSYLVLAVVACGAVSIVRWLIAMTALRSLRRRSRPVEDAALLALANELRDSIGIVRTVELRESPEIGTAATFGIRRPVILVAADRAAWTAADVRAVLSHEFAHIRRRDYAWALAIRACLVVNGCHPLVRWLASRLRIAQEIAADQLAAPFAGGVAIYRRSLARLALAQDGAWLPPIAQSFGSTRNSFMGRMDMLKFMEGRTCVPGRWARFALVGLVAAIGFAVSAVRGPAQTPGAAAPAAQYPPFELGYLGDDANAFIAVRPGALLGRPDMKPVLDTVSAALNSAFAIVGLPANAIPLADVEQIVGPVEIKKLTEEQRRQQSGGERHALTMGLVLIRMNRDFDWAALLRSLPKTMPVTEKEGGLFEVKSPLFGPNPMTLRVLDKRTIVMSSATDAEVRQQRTELAKRFGITTMPEIDGAGLAMVVNNQRAHWSAAFQDHPKLAAATAALGTPKHMAFCLHWTERLTASFISDWATAPTDVNRGKETICQLLDESLRSSKPSDATDRRLRDLAAEMLRSTQVSQNGTRVKADLTSSLRWAEILSVSLHAGSASVEVKEEKK